VQDKKKKQNTNARDKPTARIDGQKLGAGLIFVLLSGSLLLSSANNMLCFFESAALFNNML